LRFASAYASGGGIAPTPGQPPSWRPPGLQSPIGFGRDWVMKGFAPTISYYEADPRSGGPHTLCTGDREKVLGSRHVLTATAFPLLPVIHGITDWLGSPKECVPCMHHAAAREVGWHEGTIGISALRVWHPIIKRLNALFVHLFHATKLLHQGFARFSSVPALHAPPLHFMTQIMGSVWSLGHLLFFCLRLGRGWVKSMPSPSTLGHACSV